MLFYFIFCYVWPVGLTNVSSGHWIAGVAKWLRAVMLMIGKMIDFIRGFKYDRRDYVCSNSLLKSSQQSSLIKPA